MGSVNINTFMKSKAYTEPSVKDAAKQNYCNEFSKVINKKLGEERNNTKTAAEHRVSEKSNLAEDPNLKGDKVDAAVKTEEPKIEENANEQLMLLIQLLMSFEDKAGAQDADKLKQSISELLLGSISGENKDNNKNNSGLYFKLINFNKVDVNGLVNTENNLKQQVEVLVSQIIEKLSTDSDLRTQLISKMSGELQRASVNDNEAFKQAIIKELSSLVKQGTDNKIESHAPVMEFETLSNIQPSEKGETETNEGSIERRNSENTEVNAKAVNKEDKLLKDLVLDDSTKSTKDSISDKIANVVTRFEAIRTDKPAVVEAQVVINRNNLNADFIKAVKFMEVNNIQELSVKVIPKDLGEIVIRLSMDNGVMKASISTSNKETYNLLNSQLTVISNQLADQNMNIQSFNLSLYNGDNFLFSGKGNDQDEKKQQGKKATKVNSVDSDEVMVQEYETESSNINALA